MKVKVRFFVRCREIAGKEQKKVEIEDGMMLKDLMDLLIKEYPDLKNETLIVSLNRSYVKHEAKLKDNDEIAVFTPVSGG